MYKANRGTITDVLRRWLSLCLTALLLLSIAGCGNGKNEEPQEPAKNGDPQTNIEEDDGTPKEDISLLSAIPSVAVERYNLVLVLDTSGSVSDADPERKALDAACMFLDSLFIAGKGDVNQQGVPKTTVGVIAYNDTASIVQTISEIPSQDAVDTLKNKIYGTPCLRGTGDEGLGDALYQAADMLNRVNPALLNQQPTGPMQKNMIILFTDGYTGTLPAESSLPSPVVSELPGMPGQPVAVPMPNFGPPVQDRLADALNLAVQSRSEVFVVGLDAKTMGSQWKQFRGIANYTQMIMPDVVPPGQALGMTVGGMMPLPGQVSNTDSAIPGMSGTFSPGMENEELAVPPTQDGNSGIFARDTDDPVAPDSVNAAVGVNYFRAVTITQVQDFYVQMLAALMQGSGAKSPLPTQVSSWAEYKAPVNTAGISALLFFILTDSQIIGMRLIDPDGRELNLNKVDDKGWMADGTVRLQWWKGYTTLSVLDPKPGTWTVMAKDEKGMNPFHAQYILVGGLVLDLSVLRSEGTKNLSSATAVVRALYQNEPVSEEFYQSVTCTCEVFQVPPPAPVSADQAGLPTVQSGFRGMTSQESPAAGTPPPAPPVQPPRSVELHYDANLQAMAGTFTVDFPGDYQVRANMESSGVPYYIEKSLTMKPGVPQTISLSGQGDKTTLSPVLIGWENLPVTIQSWNIDPEDLLSVELNGVDSLSLRANHSGTGTLSVIVYVPTSDGQLMQRWNLSYPIQAGS